MGTELIYENWDDHTQNLFNNNSKDFMDIIKWAYQEYNDRILYACSFGAEAVVLIDLISKINPLAKIVFLDTDLHFKETYELIEKVKKRYPTLKINMVKPNLSLDQQADKYGKNLWERNPNLCCNLRKIEPLEKELLHVDAWISGIRREQSASRKNTQYVNKDNKFKRIKICPLIHWTENEIWEYIKLNNLPYNVLHDNNYPSIGCEMCTFQVKPGNENRSGRWANFEKKECGLHQT